MCLSFTSARRHFYLIFFKLGQAAFSYDSRHTMSDWCRVPTQVSHTTDDLQTLEIKNLGCRHVAHAPVHSQNHHHYASLKGARSCDEWVWTDGVRHVSLQPLHQAVVKPLFSSAGYHTHTYTHVQTDQRNCWHSAQFDSVCPSTSVSRLSLNLWPSISLPSSLHPCFPSLGWFAFFHVVATLSLPLSVPSFLPPSCLF